MRFLTRRSLIRAIDTARVEAAIAAAEAKSSGEIRVSVAPFFWGSVRNVAERAFDRLGMRETQDRSGVLFFIVPSRRRFVVLGDQGIHEKAGQELWEAVAAAMSEHFRRGDFTEGLVRGIEAVGVRLAEHFPHRGAADVNELPDAVDFKGKAEAPPSAPPA
jgi:uncharacterized membrane protein